MNTLHIDFCANETGAEETAIVVNGARVGTVIVARLVDSPCCNIAPSPVFEAFGLDDISRGEFHSRAAAALSLMAV